MKYSTLAVAAATIFMTFGASDALAQDGRRANRATGEERIDRTVERLDEKLDLTDAQEAQLRELLESQAADIKAWHEANEDASREDRHEFMEGTRESRQAALEAVLTAEQLAELEEMGPPRRHVRRQGPQDGPPDGRDGQQSELNLSDEQKSQLKEVRETLKDEMKAWREANPEATRDERRAFMEESREANRASLEAILTDEQLAIMEERGATERHRRGDGRRGGRHGFGGLDLTDDQKASLNEVREEMRAAATAWRESNPEASREERQEFRDQQRENQKQALESILTPEQLEKLEARRTERPDRRQRSEEVEARPERSGDRESVLNLSNHPNPFNPTTSIQFTLPQAGHTSLVIYDLQGRTVATLVDGQMDAGLHTATFDAEGLPTGTYLYKVSSGSITETGRMVLLK